jgi:hypothetical protein
LGFSVLFGSATASSSGNGTRDVPPALAAEIERAYPGAEILRLGDVDQTSCGSLDADPGLLSFDFNQDGMNDFVMLLYTVKKKKEERWEGALYTHHDFILATFVGVSGGKFKADTLEKLEGVMPSDFIIQMQPPGQYKTACGKGYWDCGSGEPEVVRLETPGVLFTKCEAYEVIYYLEKNRFVPVFISD